MSQGVDIFMAGRSMEWIVGAITDTKAFGATSGKVAQAATQASSVVLFNPVASGVNVYLYGLQFMCDTGGVFVSVANISADPGFASVAGLLNKKRGSAAVPVAKMESLTNDVSAAPAAATITDTLLTGANAEFPYFGGNVVDTLLLPGQGVRIYVPGQAGVVNFAVNLDWVEY